MQSITEVIGLFLALPAALVAIIQLINWAKDRETEPPKKEAQPNSEHPGIFKPSVYAIGASPIPSTCGICWLSLLYFEVITTTPQSGFDGPVPPWLATLMVAPMSGLAFAWWMTLWLDISGTLHPEECKKTITMKRRRGFQLTSLIIGFATPFLVMLLHRILPPP